MSDDYPERDFDPDASGRLVALLLERLAELETATRPNAGDETAKDKDLRAFQALQCAGELVRTVAGWAMDHTVGLALAGLDSVPPQPPATEHHADHIALKFQVDDHRHERMGAGAACEGGAFLDLPSGAFRPALIGLLRANSGGFPSPISGAAVTGLEALDWGETTALFEMRNMGKMKRRLREARLQLQFFGFVFYRQGLGLKKMKALEKVSGLFGVESDTARKWEQELRTSLGSLAVAREETFARNAASNVRELQGSYGKGHYKAAAISKMIQFIDGAYRDEAILRARDAYRAFKLSQVDAA